MNNKIINMLKNNKANEVNENKNNCCNLKVHFDHYDNPKIENHFNKAPKIGLQNIGATDYMNAVIQCLCHIPDLVNFFKFTIKKKDIALNNK